MTNIRLRSPNITPIRMSSECYTRLKVAAKALATVDPNEGQVFEEYLIRLAEAYNSAMVNMYPGVK